MSFTRVLKWYKRFTKGCKGVKDDSRSRRTLTSKTEVKVERVKQVMCGDRWLTVRMMLHSHNQLYVYIYMRKQNQQ